MKLLEKKHNRTIRLQNGCIFDCGRKYRRRDFACDDGNFSDSGGRIKEGNNAGLGRFVRGK